MTTKVVKAFKPCLLSPQLIQVVGSNHLTRPQVLKALWGYVKANNIPKDSSGKYIADAKLQSVLDIQFFTPVDVMKGISKHITKDETKK